MSEELYKNTYKTHVNTVIQYNNELITNYGNTLFYSVHVTVVNYA